MHTDQHMQKRVFFFKQFLNKKYAYVETKSILITNMIRNYCRKLCQMGTIQIINSKLR